MQVLWAVLLPQWAAATVRQGSDIDSHCFMLRIIIISQQQMHRQQPVTTATAATSTTYTMLPATTTLSAINTWAATSEVPAVGLVVAITSFFPDSTQTIYSAIPWPWRNDDRRTNLKLLGSTVPLQATLLLMYSCNNEDGNCLFSRR